MTLNTEEIFNIIVSGRSNYTEKKLMCTGSLLTKGFWAENKPEFFYKYFLLILPLFTAPTSMKSVYSQQYWMSYDAAL